jgi:hypothetical protein
MMHLIFGIGFSLVTLLVYNDAIAGLQITSPADGTVVLEGSTLTVTVSVDPGSNYIAVEVLGENIGFSQDVTSPPFQFTLTMPIDQIGPHQITAVGIIGPGQADFSVPLTVDLETPANIPKLSVSPSQVNFHYPGQQIPLVVTGTTDGGMFLNLSDSSQTSYQSADNSVATVLGKRLLTAVGQGSTESTTITVAYKGLTVTVPVNVPRTIPGDLNLDGVVDQDDMNLLLAAIRANMPATGPFDSRDLNHDGVIDILDAQALVSLCTKPCTIPITPIDTIPPTTTATSSPPPNAAGWNNTNVNITLTSTDNAGGSGVKEIHYTIGTNPQVIVPGASAAINLTSEGIFPISYYGVDNAGNVEGTHSLTVKIDKTPPTLGFGGATPAPNAAGWNNTNVSVPFTNADNLSGVASTNPATSPLVLTAEGTAVTGIVTVTDVAGNSATFTSPAFKIDKTPPTLNMPSLSATYTYKTTITPTFSANDALSGIASSVGTLNGNAVTSGTSITLSKPGLNTFTLTASDVAGNTVTQSATFAVLYNFIGFLPPIPNDGSGVFKLGSVVPVKFQLTDASGAFVSTAVASLTVQMFSGTTPVGTPIDATPPGGADTGNLFRYDSTSNQYIYNLSTQPESVGTWQLQAHLDDGTVYTVIIGLK